MFDFEKDFVVVVGYFDVEVFVVGRWGVCGGVFVVGYGVLYLGDWFDLLELFFYLL